MRNALVSAAVSAVVSAATFFVLRAAVGPAAAGGAAGPQVDVPNLAGLKPDQARQLLEPRGLQLELTEQVDDPRYEPGSIADQQPLSSSRVARGTAIRAKVVRAGERARVPAVVGRTEAEAKAMLEAVRLKAGTQLAQPNPTVPAGSIVASTPAAGASVAPGTAVDLVISSGPAGAGAPAASGAAAPAAAPAVVPAAAKAPAPAPALAVGAPGTVPKVTGRSVGLARYALQKSGYEVGETRKGRDEDIEHGVILKQTPAAGTPAPKGTKVDLVINDTD
jgi:beta-lactam-binding protein with PASTA domain